MLSTFKKDKSSDHSSIQPPKTECFVYDLYAVCNHHGDDLQGGHYTATCRNPTDGQWYTFDDMHTNKVEENEVHRLPAGLVVLLQVGRHRLPHGSDVRVLSVELVVLSRLHEVTVVQTPHV